MKRKELQQFSKEVLAAAIVGLSVAGTTVSVQAADHDDAQTHTAVESSLEEQNEGVQKTEEVDTTETTSDTIESAETKDEQKQVEENIAEVEPINNEIDGEGKVTTSPAEGTEDAQEDSIKNQEEKNSPEAGEEKQVQEIVSNDVDSEQEQAKSSEDENKGQENQNDGWIQDGEDWYYYKDGVMYQNELVEIENKETGEKNYYRFDENGRRMTSEWYTDYTDGWSYYYDSNGVQVTGITEINGEKYMFGSQGELFRNYYDEVYRTDINGKLVTGWYQDNYYYSEDGEITKGFAEIDGKTYYFDENSGEVLKNNCMIYNGCFYEFSWDGSITYKQEVTQDGFLDAEQGKYYIQNGEILRNQFVTVDSWKYYLEENGKVTRNSMPYVYDEETGCYYEYRFDNEGHMLYGWQELYGQTWYYDQETGRAYTEGFYEIDGKIYYFEGCRRQQNTSRFIDGNFYYFGNDGSIEKQIEIKKDGWVQMPDAWYYVKENTLLSQQWLILNGKTYYFDYEGKMLANEERYLYVASGDEGGHYRFDKSGAMITGWYTNNSGDKYYYGENGKAVSGIVEINGDTYCFSDDGRAMVDTIEIKEGIFYKFGSDGKAEVIQNGTEDGFVNIGNNTFYVKDGQVVKGEFVISEKYTYYFDYSGIMVKDNITGIYEDGTTWKYQFDQDGHMLYGWQTYNGETYYYDKETGRGFRGLHQIDGNEYYFDSYMWSGRMVKNITIQIDDEICYFGEDGKLTSKVTVKENGWIQMPNGWFYVQNSKMLQGQWLVLGEKKYYFGFDGAMYFDRMLEVYDNPSGEYIYYWFGEDGSLRTGWYTNTESDQQKYFGENGCAVKGYQKINNAYYFFNEYDGSLEKDVCKVINGELIYFGNDGKAVERKPVPKDGWCELAGAWYVIKNGKISTNQWFYSGNKWYYLDYNGKMMTDIFWWTYDESEKDYCLYHFDNNGAMSTGWYTEAGNTKYYFNESGRAVKGYQVINGIEYYFDENCMLVQNRAIIIDNQLVYIDENGKIGEQQTISRDGWYKLSNTWYYIKDKTLLRDTLLQLGTKKYYLDYEGKMLKNQMRGLDQNMTGKYTWYYFNNDGSAHVGWKYNYGSKYYFLEDGSAAQGIVEIDGIWYGFGEQGYLVYDRCIEQDGKLYYCSSNGIANMAGATDLSNDGWKQMPNGWYFSKDGHILKEQWLQFPFGKYYLSYDGSMYQNTYMYIGGKYYRFDQSGNMVTGMYIDDSGYKYYYNADGTAAGGLIEYNGKLYYADISQEGRITSNQIIYANGKLYSTDVYGVCTQVEGTGWICGTYYIMNGKACLGWKYINENWYYFDLDNASKYYDSVRTINEVDYSFDSTGALETGWIKNSDGGYYFANSSGALIKDKWMQLSNTWYYFKDKLMATGLIQIDGKNQLFNNNGAWIGEWENNSSTGWKQSGSDWYYVEKGNIVVNTIKSIGNALYYFDEYGKMLANQRYNGYYLTSSGAALQSKWLQDATGQWTYFGSDGKNIINGWKQIGASKYYFCNGAAVMNNTVIDGVLYYFNSDGIYLEKSEILSNGWKLINGDYYYFENGDMVRNRLMVINGRKYAFDGAGRMIIEGFYQENINSDLYYFNKYGEVASNGWQNNNTIYVGVDGKVLKGLQTINGKQYYFSYDGNGGYIHAKTSDCVSSDGKQIYVINEKTHEIQDIININGTRWYKTSNGKWFYAKDGKLAEAGHSYIINGARYMFDENGAMWENEDVFSKLLLMTIDIEGYANSTGVITSNGWCGDVYYLNGKFMTGAHVIDGKYYYFINAKKTSGIYFVDGNYYRYDTDGNRNIVSLKNGWVKESGNWYYVENGVIQRNCEKYINGTEYQFDGFGRLVCNSWQYVYENNDYIGRRVYLDENGFLTKGWKTIDGKTYYFDKIGRAVTGKQTIDGKTYYFNSEGAMI